MFMDGNNIKDNEIKAKEVKRFKTILAMDFNGDELDELYWDRIKGSCDNLQVISKEDSISKSILQSVDCLLVKIAGKVDKNLIDQMPNLKYVSILATGYGGIDVKYLTEKGITFSNVVDYSTQAVAEITFGLILNTIRNIDKGLIKAKEGNYLEDGFAGSEIGDKTFGIIGMGAIGTRVAKLAKAFGADVQYWSKNRKESIEKEGVVYKELDEVLKTSDFVSINLALNDDTKGVLGEDKIQIIKKNAVVVNLSPMELIDLSALADRLSKNDMTFILDHADEMVVDDIELINKYLNCIIQLPIGYTTIEARGRKQERFVGKLEEFACMFK